MERYRFYVPGMAWEGAGEVRLSEGEGHHARGVLRLGAGAEVVLFDGVGVWALGKIVRVEKKGVWVCRSGVAVREGRAVPALTVATAVPKGERAEWLIEQASQLNVSCVQLLDCERSVVRPGGGGGGRGEGGWGGGGGGGKLEKWRRLAVESAKQCGRAHVMGVEGMVKLAEVCPPGGAGAGANRVLWLDPRPDGKSVGEAVGEWQGGVMALIGPEGGWSAGERVMLEDAADAGWLRRVRLTATVLRIETACAAVAALVMGR